MATAPDWMVDEKKLRRGLGRLMTDTGEGVAREGARIPKTGAPGLDYMLAAGNYAAKAAAGTADLAGDRFNEVVNNPRNLRRSAASAAAAPAAALSGAAALLAPDLPAASAPSNAAPRSEQPLPRQKGGRSPDVLGQSLSRDALRGAGLTRIVKTGNGTYTDDPNATGEVRYYDAMGGRADTGEVKPNFDDINQFYGPNLAGPMAVQRYNDAQQAAQLDLSNPDVTKRILERGRDSKRVLADRNAEAADRMQDDLPAALSPSDRTKLATEQIKETGLDRRAAAANEIAMASQRASMINAQGTQAQRQFDNSLNLSDRLTNAEADKAQAEWARLFAPLKGLSREERVQAIADPNSPYALALALAERNAAESNRPSIFGIGGVKNNFDFGDLQKSGWRPYVPFINDYTDTRAGVGGGIDLDNLPAEVRDILPELIDLRRRQAVANRGG